MFRQLFSELAAPNPGDARPEVRLLDGERALWEAKRVYFPEALGILVLLHLLERLRAESRCFHKECNAVACEFVEHLRSEDLKGSVAGSSTRPWSTWRTTGGPCVTTST